MLNFLKNKNFVKHLRSNSYENQITAESHARSSILDVWHGSEYNVNINVKDAAVQACFKNFQFFKKNAFLFSSVLNQRKMNYNNDLLSWKYL